MFFLGRCSQALAIFIPAPSSPRSSLQGSPPFTSPTRQPWTCHKLSWSSFFSGFPRVHPCKSCTSVQRSILLTILLLPIISISSSMKERVKRIIVMCASCRHCSLIDSHHHHHHDCITTISKITTTIMIASGDGACPRPPFPAPALSTSEISSKTRPCWLQHTAPISRGRADLISFMDGGWQREGDISDVIGIVMVMMLITKMMVTMVMMVLTPRTRPTSCLPSLPLARSSPT